MQLPILPSNAPALPDGLGPEGPVLRGILQEHSGNLQHDFPLSEHHIVKSEHAVTSASENRYSHAYHTSDRRWHNSDRIPHARRSHRRSAESEEQRIAKETIKLWRRFRNHEGYCKYREKQKGGDGASGDQTWPENMEMAFFRALVVFPPMGRRKTTSGGSKLRGRNELIADHIKELTGEHRTRKQVSSHIQVLKPWVKDDLEIMSYLTLPNARHARVQSHRGLYGGNNSYYDQTHAEQLTTPYAYPQMDQHSIKEEDVVGMGLMGGHCIFLEPADFDMYVLVRSAPHKRIHTYTAFAKDSRLPRLRLESFAELQQAIPQLAPFVAADALDCPVVLCSASLDLTPLKVAFPPDAELAISFELLPDNRMAYDNFRCCSSFFDDGELIRDVSTASDDPRSWGDIAYDGTRRRHTKVPLSSRFWAKRISCLQKLLRDAQREENEAGCREDEAAIKMRESAGLRRQKVLDDLRKLNAVQEIYATPIDSTEPQRVMIIHWNFSEAIERTVPTTTWRTLSVAQPPATKDQPSSQHMHLTSIPELDFNDIPVSHEQQIYDGQAFDYYTDQLQNLPSLSTDVGASILPSDMDRVADLNGLPGAGLQDIDFNGGHIDIRMGESTSGEAYTTDGSQRIFDPVQHDQMEHYSYEGQYVPYDIQYHTEGYPTPSLSTGSGYAKEDNINVLPSTEFHADAPDGSKNEPGLIC